MVFIVGSYINLNNNDLNKIISNNENEWDKTKKRLINEFLGEVDIRQLKLF